VKNKTSSKFQLLRRQSQPPQFEASLSRGSAQKLGVMVHVSDLYIGKRINSPRLALAKT
jgi:hypothetical protein